MAVMLNRQAYEHAKQLINDGRIVLDERDAWSEHRPSAEQENAFIHLHGFAEYGKWHLGLNDEKPRGYQGTLRISLWGFQECPPLRRSRGGEPRRSIPAL
jgi:hypothetical protein